MISSLNKVGRQLQHENNNKTGPVKGGREGGVQMSPLGLFVLVSRRKRRGERVVSGRSNRVPNFSFVPRPINIGGWPFTVWTAVKFPSCLPPKVVVWNNATPSSTPYHPADLYLQSHNNNHTACKDSSCLSQGMTKLVTFSEDNVTHEHIHPQYSFTTYDNNACIPTLQASPFALHQLKSDE